MTAASVRLGTGPVSWGVDFAEADGNPPWERVLDEIAASGFTLTELGPVGYLPDDPELLRQELERRDLAVAGSFLFQPLHDPRSRDEVLAVARRTCAAISGVGGRFLVVIDAVSEERAATAGRSAVAPRLGPEARTRLIEAIGEISELAREEFGLRPVLHNHAGTCVEFEDEIEAILGALGPVALGLCIDTGHAVYAGIDPVDLFERHAARVEYLHLKDVDPQVLERARRTPLDFWGAIAAGVFCPVGRGSVDFDALGKALMRRGFDGYATVEQDRDPRSSREPLADVVASREYLERVGLAA